MKIESVYIGGWFQRTTLHLTEMHHFFSHARSELDFPIDELQKLHDALHIQQITRCNWLLEYLHATTSEGIDMRTYEDGLIVLRKTGSNDLQKDFVAIEDYYDHALSPAISYIFSKGAPVPKELAHMKTLFPFIVVTRAASAADVKIFFDKLGLAVYSEVSVPNVQVYKSNKVILIVARGGDEQARPLVEAQIFFREFKGQLQRYLNIHRTLWEQIAAIKERGRVKGKEVRGLRSQLDDAQKTIKLIESRINQMSAYLRTRAKVAATQKIDAALDQIFAYKFETLEDTLAYVKELWKMTDNYLSAALARFNEIQAESTKNSITSLRLITTLGVVAGIVGYLSKDTLPTITLYGGAFFVTLLVLTWIFNEAVSAYYARKQYVLRKESDSLIR